MAILPSISDKTNVTRGASVSTLNEARTTALTTLQDVLAVLGTKHPELTGQLAQINAKLVGLDVDLDAAIANVQKSDVKTGHALEAQIPAIKAAINDAIKDLPSRFGGSSTKIESFEAIEGKLVITHGLHWSEDAQPLMDRVADVMARTFPGVPYDLQSNGLE